MILTSDGYKKICDVEAGDYVLTHENTYQRVIESKCTGEKEIFKINAMSIDELKCTSNHKFFVRKMSRHYPTYPNGKRGSVRVFSSPAWVECKDLDKSYYLGIAINQKSVMPEWNGITYTWKDGRKPRHKDNISNLMHDISFWNLIGMYVGDGWHRSQGGIVICGNERKCAQIKALADNLGYGYTIVKERTVYKCHIPDKELELFVSPFGRGSSKKRIPGFMFDLPNEYIRAFLDGYMASDGYANGSYKKISSVSRELIYGTGQLVAKAYHAPYRIYRTKRNNTCEIEGRVVNQRDSYEVVWKEDKRKQDKAFYEDGYVWFPITNVEKTGCTENVFDIEVEKSHSFVANGVIAHNCTDLSLAGKRAGMEKGSGTRSGLLWEVERLLNEMNELPQVLLMENVDAVHGTGNLEHFQDWIGFLDGLGYSTYYEDLNAKDYGVAQNRNRCFAVSLLGDYVYHFPVAIPLNKTMKDYLEDEVAEKYYLRSEKAKRLIEELIVRGELDIENDTTTSLTDRWCIDLSTKEPQTRSIANCIKTRQRGIVKHAQEENGVVEL